VLENPDMISKRVLEKGLDAGTAYEILSIDIADVDVGKNIGAELETDRAEADKKIAQAKAEESRAMAFAVEQEMKARVQEMRAKVVEAEAKVPLAMAEAFQKGNLGIMDYYRMKNIDGRHPDAGHHRQARRDLAFASPALKASAPRLEPSHGTAPGLRRRRSPSRGPKRSLSGQDLRQAVIWSEILGPPKALREVEGNSPLLNRD
jgi:hypothetical protein